MLPETLYPCFEIASDVVPYTLQAMAERPEAQTNLGYVYGSLGDVAKTDAAYNKAMILNPSFVPAYLNRIRR